MSVQPMWLRPWHTNVAPEKDRVDLERGFLSALNDATEIHALTA